MIVRLIRETAGKYAWRDLAAWESRELISDRVMIFLHSKGITLTEEMPRTGMRLKTFLPKLRVFITGALNCPARDFAVELYLALATPMTQNDHARYHRPSHPWTAGLGKGDPNRPQKRSKIINCPIQRPSRE